MGGGVGRGEENKFSFSFFWNKSYVNHQGFGILEPPDLRYAIYLSKHPWIVVKICVPIFLNQYFVQYSTQFPRVQFL